MRFRDILESIKAPHREVDTSPQEPQPALNRAQRRQAAQYKPGELQMRYTRTAIAQAKRRSKSRGEHGASAVRAFRAGINRGMSTAERTTREAYLIGLERGKAQRGGWLRRLKAIL